MPMQEKQKTILQTSKVATEVKRAAVEAATSDSDADIVMIGDMLASADFLNRLDSAKEYEGTYSALRLGQVMDGLVQNRRPACDKVLLSLIDAPGFQAHVLRIQLLIYALAVIKPSPPASIMYWDRLSVGGSPVVFDVIAALTRNQSAPAMQLFERKVADPKHAATLKRFWMHQLIVPIRNDEPILTACEHLVRNDAVSPEVKIYMVESLFDYQPEEWYRGCSPVKPPIRAIATTAAKDTMARIAEFALASLNLPAALKLRTEAVLKEVRR